MPRTSDAPLYSLVAACALLCCAAPAPAEPAQAQAQAPATPPGAVTSAPTPPATPPPQPSSERPARRPVTAADNTAQAAYADAMQIGRTQTRAKAYGDAIAAFDRALAARPNTSRALAERGYARLLAKDLEGARNDLELARQRTQDPARLGPIWFNVGLVAEAAGNAEGAQRAFALSNQLRPSKAAAARLGGKQVCTAEVERTPKSALAFASWKLLHDHLRADTEEPALTTDAQVQQTLNLDPALESRGLWNLHFYNAASVGTNSRASLLVGRAADRDLLLFGELYFAETGNCQPHGVLTVTPVGGLMHARHVEFQMDWDLVPIDPNDPNNVPCDNEGEIPPTCEFDCHVFAANVDDYILDLTGKQQLLHVRRSAHQVTTEDPKALEAALPIAMTVTPQAVTLKGGGCDLALPLP